MRTILILALMPGFLSLAAQNPDLPAPVTNLQTLPAGSYVIAMDNTNQQNNSGYFNIKSYGLIVHLLNYNVKLQWVITAGKAKDAVDFSVNATKFKPSSGTASVLSFRAGPMVIFASDTTGVAAKIDAFNSSISNTNDKIKVYRTNASVSVDIRYDMTGFIPKAALLDDGGNSNVHEAYMEACNIPSLNYLITLGTQLLTDCYTFASEAHNSQTGQNQDNAITAVKRFVEYGGNFLAQCAAIETYENNSLGHFQTTSGITKSNTNAGTNISYPNPDLSFSQFEGNYNISIGGSFKNWRLNASGINSFHKQAKSTADTTVVGSSVSKLHSGIGGLVFYLGNHKFDKWNDEEEVNGVRMYMNAFITPVTVARYCEIGEPYMYPLAANLISFTGGSEHQNISLSWEVAENENIREFDLEKSEDGTYFSSALLIKAQNKSGRLIYNADQQMKTDRIFYRLKLTGSEGIASYSRVLAFQSAEANNTVIRVLNQPVSDRLEFSFPSDKSGLTEIRVSDLMGRTAISKIMNVNPGHNKLQLTLPYAWPDGIYLLEVRTGNHRLAQKFLKQ